VIEILVPHAIRDRELAGEVSGEARKIFAKLKTRTPLATGIRSPGLPSRTSLYKVHATSPAGARRLLVFCRHSHPGPSETDRWVLLFYRSKSDSLGRNLGPAHPNFARESARHLAWAIADLELSTAATPRYETF
jgi:hypothetical protein